MTMAADFAIEDEKIQEFVGDLPPGYYFVPSDLQIINQYLIKKILGLSFETNMIKTNDLVQHTDPDALNYDEFKYCRRKEAYYVTKKGKRDEDGSGETIIKTTLGYWRKTKDESPIIKGDQIVGYKKSFTFYEQQGKELEAKETLWRLTEYTVTPQAIPVDALTNNVLDKIEETVACRIRYKQPKSPVNFFCNSCQDEEDEE